MVYSIGEDFNITRFASKMSNGDRVTRSMRAFNDFISKQI